MHKKYSGINLLKKRKKSVSFIFNTQIETSESLQKNIIKKETFLLKKKKRLVSFAKKLTVSKL